FSCGSSRPPAMALRSMPSTSMMAILSRPKPRPPWTVISSRVPRLDTGVIRKLGAPQPESKVATRRMGNDGCFIRDPRLDDGRRYNDPVRGRMIHGPGADWVYVAWRTM